MSRKASPPNSLDSLPPIDVNAGSNITQLKTPPASYIQDAKVSTPPRPPKTHNSRNAQELLQSSEPQPPTVPDRSPVPQRSSGQSGVPDEPSAISIPALPMPPRPPSSTKSPKHPEADKKTVPIFELHPRLTERYVKKWTITDLDIERCIEDINFAIRSLRETHPILTTCPSEFTLLFRILAKAVIANNKCSDSNKSMVVRLILDNGWVAFIINCFQLIQSTGDWTLVAVENMMRCLEILRHPILTMESEVACQIFDQYFDVVCSYLDQPFVFEVAVGPTDATSFMIVRTLLSTICDFAMLPDIRDSKMTAEQMKNVRLLLKKYMQLFKDGSIEMTTCHKAWQFLEEDSSQCPPLPLKYMAAAESVHNDPDRHADDIVYMVKRLSSISVESHFTKPWMYQNEFVFVVGFLTGKTWKIIAQAEEKFMKYYRALVKDGTWYKLLITLHAAALSKLNSGDEMNSVTKSALCNIALGLCSVVNATDHCKDPNLLQQTFDQLFEYIFNYFKNVDVVSVINGPKTFLGRIATSMVIVLHNLSYYHEPCIPIMRDRGMIPVARQIRKSSTHSRAAIDCLLIIAHLITEGDDKTMLKITDDELGYLFKELEGSMQGVRASDYHPEELIDGLNRIAVSDINKLKLMECGILKLLEKSFDSKMEYSVAHKTAAAKAVWNLAFSDESRKEIKKNSVLVAALKSLKDSPEKELRAAVSGALWQLEGKEKHLESIGHTKTVKDVQQRHIMLSYNHQAKVEVFRMKDRLKQEGYKVWIDEEQITAGGSTLEAMSTAIEDSCLVLIFFSEPYKNSVNCRAEAEYVFERRKPFLPIQVQAGYTPEGWLGILFGSKYRYTLSKPDRYDSEVTGLLGKVREHASGQLQPAIANDVPVASTAPTTAQSAPAEAPTSTKCSSWSTQQIDEWLDDNELGSYKTSFAQIDGGMLAELVMLYCQHKDAFYTLLSNKTPGIILSDTLKFGRAVQRLAME